MVVFDTLTFQLCLDNQPLVGDELWLVKTAANATGFLGGSEVALASRTIMPSFATAAAAASNAERVRLGGKYCAKGGWQPGSAAGI